MFSKKIIKFVSIFFSNTFQIEREKIICFHAVFVCFHFLKYYNSYHANINFHINLICSFLFLFCFSQKPISFSYYFYINAVNKYEKKIQSDKIISKIMKRKKNNNIFISTKPNSDKTKKSKKIQKKNIK